MQVYANSQYDFPQVIIAGGGKNTTINIATLTVKQKQNTWVEYSQTVTFASPPPTARLTVTPTQAVPWNVELALITVTGAHSSTASTD